MAMTEAEKRLRVPADWKAALAEEEYAKARVACWDGQDGLEGDGWGRSLPTKLFKAPAVSVAVMADP